MPETAPHEHILAELRTPTNISKPSPVFLCQFHVTFGLSLRYPRAPPIYLVHAYVTPCLPCGGRITLASLSHVSKPPPTSMIENSAAKTPPALPGPSKGCPVWRSIRSVGAFIGEPWKVLVALWCSFVFLCVLFLFIASHYLNYHPPLLRAPLHLLHLLLQLPELLAGLRTYNFNINPDNINDALIASAAWDRFAMQLDPFFSR